ncbi:hydroxymethylglutaryl-CoA lyase [Rhodobacter veldkampii DSM 11550]|uniref:Hydroxymethylglutaryl-CoA lyase n=1 Tax=Phaeovulum veldkampii DSM 11550 TaxID=1185920 RepID=A0A2T4JK25_9RHOB|nr:hydroxymethylglutaryl-CoA lyase [Phaeovulum veldkampii]MBK5946114.1 hydroxymethylglutaryl-CoA lyase [Phaeovulum veldkampii DSM 11550]PTE18213.1 hydroxymethylglutaryl-CoA lyase [Phaeovulum veldkampii DSM 11550]TDQ63486.1 hydroxymethylglutaryl-CoA lyase [Phaeovulum veldkampii DSM 11550]
MTRTGLYPADRVTLREVGLRDGLQLVKSFPGTAAKIDWLSREHAAGVRYFELGSFLPAARFPQFADLPDLITAACALPGAVTAALTLNERGVEAGLVSGVNEVVCVVSATEEHSQANIRKSCAESVALVTRAAALRAASGGDVLINVGIAMSFGCSIAGQVAPAQVLRLAEACLAAGADIIGIADTVGYAGPREVAALCDGMARLCGPRPFIVHLHDTRGLGLANAAAALDHGAQVLDGALGGLGGCPFAPGATGNVAFEDLAYLCERMGFATGIDIAALAAIRDILMREMPEEQLYGAVSRTGPPRNIDWRA